MGGFFMPERRCEMLTKPPNVENDAFKSAKWDELTTGCAFTQSDAPALARLRKEISAFLYMLKSQVHPVFQFRKIRL